jgi:hypothetical protein
VRAVRQLRKELGADRGTVKRVAEQLGIPNKSDEPVNRADRNVHHQPDGGPTNSHPPILTGQSGASSPLWGEQLHEGRTGELHPDCAAAREVI